MPVFAPLSFAGGQPLSETELELAEQLGEQSQSYRHLSVASIGITSAQVMCRLEDSYPCHSWTSSQSLL